MYRTVLITPRAGAEEPLIESLEFCVGERTADATVVHVRGVYIGEIPFAGCVVISEGRAIPTYDLKSYGAPLDLEQLGVTIDQLLGESSEGTDEIKRICE